MRTPERIWNDEGKEARAGAGVGEGEGGDDSRVLCKKRADGRLRGDNPQIARCFEHDDHPSSQPGVYRPLRPSLSSRRRLRSGLRGPAVKGRDVLKGTIKRMPPDANCAVRERLALFVAAAVKNDRGMISRVRRNCCYIYAVPFEFLDRRTIADLEIL